MYNVTLWNPTLWKPTVVLATILVLPLLALAAEEPASAPSAVEPAPAPGAVEPAGLLASSPASHIPLAFAGGQVGVDLPAELPGQRHAVQYLEPGVPIVRQSFCLAGDDPSLCDFGAATARMKPCLAAGAEDCPAFEAWTRVMGEPGIRPADPSVIRAADWAPPSEDD